MRQWMLLALMAIVSSFGIAQSTFEGEIQYEIEYKDLPPEMASYRSMLPSGLTMYLKKHLSRVEQPGVMGMKTVVVANTKEENGFMLMDIMGKKICVEMTKEDLEENKPDKEDVKINYLDGTKTIAGYLCKKAEVVTQEGTFYIYYTEELGAGMHQDYDMLKGFPLQYEISQEGMTMVFRATSITEKKLATTLFEVPEGYEKMTTEEFKSSMGQ